MGRVSEPTTVQRPRQVSLLAYTIMVGSAFVVILVFQTLANLHTLDTREAVEAFLADPPADELGLSVSDALGIMRVLGMVAAACATAAGILGFFVLRGHRQARIVLTILAVPLIVSGAVAGGFLAAVVASATVLLWFSPAREWFNGEPIPEYGARRGDERRDEARSVVSPPSVSESGSDSGSDAGSDSGLDSGSDSGPGRGSEAGPVPAPSAPGRAAPPPYPAAYGDPAAAPVPLPGAVATPQRRLRRPPPVAFACALTWIFSGMAVLSTVSGLVYLGVRPDPLLEEMHKQNPDLASQGISDNTLLAATFAIGGMFVVWAIGAIVLAVFVWRGAGWARVVLILSTVGAVGLCLLGTLSSLVFLGPLLGAGLTVSLLLRPESAAWTGGPLRR